MTSRYLIATTPRSGSSFLCDLLHKSGAAGMRPAAGISGWEYLGIHLGEVDDGRSALDVLDAAFRRSECGGVEGFKAMWPDIASLFSRCRGQEERQALRAELGKLPWLRLRRRDRTAQAVSWAKAVQSQQWTSLKRHWPRPRRIEYNYFLIARRFADARRNDRAWDRWFDEMGIEPLELVYEDFVQDLPGTVENIARHLRIELACRPEATNYEVQRDATNAQWARRFQRDRRSSASRLAALARSALARSTWRELMRRIREALAPSAPRSRPSGAPRT